MDVSHAPVVARGNRSTKSHLQQCMSPVRHLTLASARVILTAASVQPFHQPCVCPGVPPSGQDRSIPVTMSPTPTQTLMIHVRGTRVVSRAALLCLIIGILGNLGLGILGGPPSAIAQGMLKIVAVLAGCSLATTVEDLLFQRLRRSHRLARLLVQFTLAPVALSLTVAGAMTVGVSLRDLGDSGTMLLVLVSAGVWLASASFGSLVVLILDGVVARITSTLRVRLNLTVLSLLVMAAGLAYGAAQLGPGAAEFIDELQQTQFGIRFELGSIWLWETIRLLGPEEARDLLALTYFVVLVIVALPAVLSASGKLAESVMDGLGPFEAGFEAVARGELDFRLPEDGVSDFSRFAETFNQMVSSLALGKRMERAFGSYVSEEILDQIKGQHGQATLEPSLRMATVFFVDIRGFTTLSERINPKQLLGVLNRFYESVAEVVDEHRGFLVQYIGDAVVVVFNGPIDQPDHALLAASCAIDIQVSVDKLNEARSFPEIGQLSIGIGIATGPLVAGNLGDSRHLLQYTVLGDTVNQASRLTGRVPAGAIWCNQRNAESVARIHDAVALKPMKVKGRARRLVPHQLWPRIDQADATDVFLRATAPSA
jgi:class 3 adenylate cyclase